MNLCSSTCLEDRKFAQEFAKNCLRVVLIYDFQRRNFRRPCRGLIKTKCSSLRGEDFCLLMLSCSIVYRQIHHCLRSEAQSFQSVRLSINHSDCSWTLFRRLFGPLRVTIWSLSCSLASSKLSFLRNFLRFVKFVSHENGGFNVVTPYRLTTNRGTLCIHHSMRNIMDREKFTRRENIFLKHRVTLDRGKINNCKNTKHGNIGTSLIQ